jgi:hypothetical protein
MIDLGYALETCLVAIAMHQPSRERRREGSHQARKSLAPSSLLKYPHPLHGSQFKMPLATIQNSHSLMYVFIVAVIFPHISFIMNSK